jgi:tight adherence protein B
MDGMLVLTAVVVAGAIFAAALALQNALTSTRVAVQARTVGAGVTVDQGPAILVRREGPMSDRSRRTALQLERAGLALTPGEYRAVRLACAVLAALALLLLSPFGRSLPAVLAVAAPAFLVGYWLPSRYVAGRREKRLNRIEEQLLEALVSMAKSLKAGVGLTQALEYAAREAGEPLGTELLRVVREMQLGADLEVVLEEMNGRIGSTDLEIVSTAIVIQRRVGGNLSEILSNVANTIRERRRIRNELFSVTAKQRLQGNLSALLPPAVAGLFFLINPDMAGALIHTTAGLISLAVGIFFELLGLWMVRFFARIEV